jgi:uncharacterized alpha/beta hydrolase family protein
LNWLKKNYFVFLMVAGLIYCSYYLLYRVDSVKSQSNQNFASATVFIHGYKGTHLSFQSMLNRFQNEYHWGKKVLICNVTNDGRLLLSEQASFNKKDHIFIQVVFEDNRASFEDTAFWLSKVMSTLKSKYGMEEVNLVGHSMGGIISTKFLEDYGGKPEYPKVTKLITIGSPFLGLNNPSYLATNWGAAKYDLMPKSSALQELIRKRGYFPEETRAYAIAGTGDQLVTVNSALSLKKIVPKSHYKEAIIEDNQINHSGLHESLKVDKLISRFLWRE